MKRVQGGFVTKRGDDGEFLDDRPIYRDIADDDVDDSGLTKCERRHLKLAADNVFAELARDNPLFRR